MKIARRFAISVCITVLSFSHLAYGGTDNAQSQLAGSDSTGGASEDGSLSEIVVNASRRDERLRDVPSAISVVSGDRIAELGITSIEDYESFVPGLATRENGTNGFGAVILRGMNTGPEQNTATAAFYMDEAPTTGSSFSGAGAFINPDVELADVARIEVLKGPQGTLYGANSLGGIIRVISATPDATHFSSDVRSEVTSIDGGSTGYLVKGALNVPLVTDLLALRVSASYRDVPGFTDNVGTGTKNANTGDDVGFRAALRATPTPDLTIGFSTLYQDLRSNGYTQQDNFTASTTPIYGQDKYSNYYNAGNETLYRIASGSVEYNAGPVQSITNVSYVKQTTNLGIDFTDIYLPLVAALVPPGTGVPGVFLSDLSKWTVDTRLVSKRLGPVEFIAGAYYTNEFNNFQPGIFLANQSTGQDLPPPASALVAQQNLGTYKEHAFYGDLTYYITDQIDIQGGARYSDNSQTIDATKVGLLLGLATPQTFDYDFSSSVMTYLATLRWRLNDSVSTYVRAASGYRPGGPLTSPVAPPNTPTTVKPDSDWNYEVGMSGAFLDNKLNITTSIYQIDWRDIQLQGLSNGIQYQTNGGTAKIDGVELQIDARPTQHLTLGLVGGYTDARMETVSAAGAAGIGARPGDALPLTPRYTAATTADYTIPLEANLKGTVGATVRYRSNMPTSFSGDPLNNNIDLGTLTTADLRSGITFGSVDVIFRVSNVFDRRGFVSSTDRRAAPTPTPVWAVPNQPRTFTVGASTSF